jgi:hypothetical protein
MAKPSTGRRLVQLGLEQELVNRLIDFREGYLGAPEGGIISEALELFMQQELERNPSVRERYEAARRKRTGTA